MSNNARWAPGKAAFWSVAALTFWLIPGVLSWGSPQKQAADEIFYSKSFPGSIPEYFEIAVDSNGRASYREDPDSDEALEFTLSAKEVREVFARAGALDHFKRPLQADRKVAFTGAKTLRFTSAAGEQSEVEFTYSTDKDAQAIVQWFERASETERHLIELERVVQFDRLGVNKALLQFQISFDDGRVVAAEQFLPILKGISDDSKVMHMARSRAAALVERIESAAP